MTALPERKLWVMEIINYEWPRWFSSEFAYQEENRARREAVRLLTNTLICATRVRCYVPMEKP